MSGSSAASEIVPFATALSTGERRQVTVLFADMAGYTTVAERLGEEGAYDLMQTIFAGMAAAVREQGGTVRDFTGDGIMAVFGVPVALEDAPLRACKAALAIQERLAVSAADIESKHGVRPLIRVGVNTGPVVVGQIESGWASISGDTVNMASRLQTLAEPGTLVVSELTHRLVQGLVDSTFGGAHQVKGKSEPQNIYRIDAVKEGATRFDAALSRGLTPYVGREQELSLLQTRLDDATAGLRVVDIVADPGMGKSRLLHEFRCRLGKDRAFYLKGDCSPDGRATAFLAFIDVVRGSFRLVAGEPEVEIARKLDDGLTVLGLHSQERVGLLLNLLGLRAPEGALAGLDGTLIGLRTRELLHDMLQVRCRLSPVVLMIEDLHWIDSVSEAILSALIGKADTLRLLIIHTRRPEYRPPWIDWSRVTTLALEPLTAAEVTEIVRTRLKSVALPDALAELAAEKADGNALFAEEITSFLFERGVVRTAGDGIEYDASRIAQGLPASIQSVLTARLDRLADAGRLLLQAASVIGRSFDPDLLHVVADSTGNTAAELAAMQQHDLVHQDAKTGDFVFKHALVRDALYNSLLTRPRETLHLRIAEEMERRGGNRLNEIAEALAHHFDAAAHPEKAFQYLTMAAQKSVRVYSLDQAGAFFDRAAALLSVQPALVTHQVFPEFIVSDISYMQLIYEPGQLLDLINKYRDALTEMGDRVEVVVARHYEVWALIWTVQYANARQAQELASTMARRLGDAKSKAYALAGEFLLDCIGCRPSPDIVERGRSAIATAMQTADPYIIAWMRFMVAWNAGHRGHMRRARAIANDLLKAGKEMRDPRSTGLSLWLQGWVAVCFDDREEALHIAEEAVDNAITPFDVAAALTTKAIALILLQRANEGVPLLEKVRATAAEHQRWLENVGTAPAHGVSLVLRGHLAQGANYIKKQIGILTLAGHDTPAYWYRICLAQMYIYILTSKMRPPLGTVLRNCGFIIRLKLFGWHEVLSLLETALKNPLLDEENFFTGQIYFLMGLAYKNMGKPSKAADLFLRGRNIIAPHGDSMILMRVGDEIGRAQPSRELQSK
jgi:class 3 adenylate cyclase/tetratricopeptide (TPR) repeat protein